MFGANARSEAPLPLKGAVRFSSSNAVGAKRRDGPIFLPRDSVCDKFATHSQNDGDDRPWPVCFEAEPNLGLDVYVRYGIVGAGNVHGRRAMSEYSIYTITNEDRQFSESCTVVHCADDIEAIEAAAQWVDMHDIELWESNRFITRLHASNVQMVD
jgi:hypothetical protein